MLDDISECKGMADGAQPDEEIIKQEWLDKLPEDQRQYLEQRRKGVKTDEKIAKSLDWPANKARRMKTRVRMSRWTIDAIERVRDSGLSGPWNEEAYRDLIIQRYVQRTADTKVAAMIRGAYRDNPSLSAERFMADFPAEAMKKWNRCCRAIEFQIAVDECRRRKWVTSDEYRLARDKFLAHDRGDGDRGYVSKNAGEQFEELRGIGRRIHGQVLIHDGVRAENHAKLKKPERELLMALLFQRSDTATAMLFANISDADDAPHGTDPSLADVRQLWEAKSTLIPGIYRTWPLDVGQQRECGFDDATERQEDIDLIEVPPSAS